MCLAEVDWVTAVQAGRLLGVSSYRVRQMIKEGRYPGAVLFRPGQGMQPFWKIPVKEVLAVVAARRES